MDQKPKEICPVCGCAVGAGAYTKDGVAYCCEPCATHKECECGCCKEVKTKK